MVVILPYVGVQICILAVMIIAFFIWKKMIICYICFIAVNLIPAIAIIQNILSATLNKPSDHGVFVAVWIVMTIPVSSILAFICEYVDYTRESREYNGIDENSYQQSTA